MQQVNQTAQRVVRSALFAAALALFATGDGVAFGQYRITGDAGLVVSVTGTTEPALQVDTEIASGSSIKFAAGSVVTFSHYQTCRTVSVTSDKPGATLTVNFENYAVTGGRITADTGAPCPQRRMLYRNAQAERDYERKSCMHILVDVSTRPSIPIVGPLSGKISRLRFVEFTTGGDGDDQVEVPVVDHRTVWVEGTLSLRESTTYTMTSLTDEGEFRGGFVRVVDRHYPVRDLALLVLYVRDEDAPFPVRACR